MARAERAEKAAAMEEGATVAVKVVEEAVVEQMVVQVVGAAGKEAAVEMAVAAMVEEAMEGEVDQAVERGEGRVAEVMGVCAVVVVATVVAREVAVAQEELVECLEEWVV